MRPLRPSAKRKELASRVMWCVSLSHVSLNTHGAVLLNMCIRSTGAVEKLADARIDSRMLLALTS